MVDRMVDRCRHGCLMAEGDPRCLLIVARCAGDAQDAQGADHAEGGCAVPALLRFLGPPPTRSDHSKLS